MSKVYKRKKSINKAIKEISLINKKVPKIIFRANNLIVTLKNKTQLKRWLDLYPEGTYQVN